MRVEEDESALVILYDLMTDDTHYIENAFLIDSNNAVISQLELGDYFRFAFLSKADVCVVIVERNSKMKLEDSYDLLLRGVTIDEERGKIKNELDILFELKFYSGLPKNLLAYQLISEVSFFDLYEVI